MSKRNDDGPEEARWQRCERILKSPPRRSARLAAAMDASRNHDATCACNACQRAR